MQISPRPNLFLNPRMTVREIVAEGLVIQGELTKVRNR